jgi:hypothetical protein
MRDGKPFLFADMRRGSGTDEIVRFLCETGGLDRKTSQGPSRIA